MQDGIGRRAGAIEEERDANVKAIARRLRIEHQRLNVGGDPRTEERIEIGVKADSGSASAPAGVVESGGHPTIVGIGVCDREYTIGRGIESRSRTVGEQAG